MAKEIGSEIEVPFHAEIAAILKVYALTALTVGGLLLLLFLTL